MADSLRPIRRNGSSRPCRLLGWRASRSSGGSRAKAGGEGSRAPVSCCYVRQRPRMLYQSHFRGEYVLMNKRGRRRMLLVLLLPWQAFGNIRNRSIGPLVSGEGSAGSQTKETNNKDGAQVAEEFELFRGSMLKT